MNSRLIYFIADINLSYIPSMSATVPPEIPGIMSARPIDNPFKNVLIWVLKDLILLFTFFEVGFSLILEVNAIPAEIAVKIDNMEAFLPISNAKTETVRSAIENIRARIANLFSVSSILFLIS